jgi:hypothetical protein
MMMSRLQTLVIAAVIAAGAAPAPALAHQRQQSPQSPQEVPSEQELASLRERVASELWVYRDTQPIHGYLTRLTKQDLTLIDEDNQEQIIPLDAIWRIERSGDRIWNGFAIGASVGVLQAIIWGAEVGRGHTAEKINLTMFSAGLYGLVGAGIDAMHVGTTTVYNAPRRKEGASITPSRDGRGAMLAWTVKF